MKFNLKAFIYHFVASISVIGLISIGVLTIWFPSPWAKVLGGYDLFFKIVMIDVFVGPLCVGLTYKPTKKKILNTMDVFIISCCQLAFMSYGFWVLSESRPAFVVFNSDRLDVLVVNEIGSESLKEGTAPYNRFSLLGPVYTAIDTGIVNRDLEKNNHMIIDLLMTGTDVSFFPKYYKEYAEEKETILKSGQSYSSIPAGKFKELADAVIARHQMHKEDFLWLPVRHKFGFIVAVLNKETALPLDYILIDSYDELKKYRSK